MARKTKTEDTSPAPSESIESVPVTAPGSVAFEIPQVVVFRIGEQLHALPIECVQEIQQIVEFTPVPGGSAALVGMIDLRGSVVPAIDLRALLGMPMLDYSLDTPMIFFRTHGRLVALLVDEVEDVVDLPDDCMQPPSNLYDLADRMIGICKLDQGLAIVLDPDRLVPDTALSSGDLFGGEGLL